MPNTQRAAGVTPLLDRKLCGITAPMLAILLLTAITTLVWSHFMQLNQDEILVLQTDTGHSLTRLVQIQTSVPISLDPLFFHVLVHFLSQITHSDVLAVRLPSLGGFLLMQICLYLFVRRALGERSAVIAAAIPALTASSFYSVEGRPYSLVLGFCALAALSWQLAASSRFRPGALLLLFLAIACAVNSHFYGVLIVVPVVTAEVWRTIRSRRFDVPVVLAITCGLAAIAAVLPVQKAVNVFREHYYNYGSVSVSFIFRAYRDDLLGANHSGTRTTIILAAAAVLFIGGLFYRAQTRKEPLPVIAEAELALVIALTVLPVFGYILARFVTKSIETRSVLPLILGVAISVAALLSSSLQRSSNYNLASIIVLVALILLGVMRIRSARQDTSNAQRDMTVSPEIQTALRGLADTSIYLQNVDWFERATVNEEDADIRSRLVLLYSRDRELAFTGHDTMSLTAMHMLAFTHLPIVRYDDLAQKPSSHLLVLYNDEWAWTTQALAASKATITPVGRLFNGEAVLVKFPETSKR